MATTAEEFQLTAQCHEMFRQTKPPFLGRQSE